MDENSHEPPMETEGREAYYEAALLQTILFCDKCNATLDPDTDLGDGISFESDRYYIPLGDEAHRRGWDIKMPEMLVFEILCPRCARSRVT